MWLLIYRPNNYQHSTMAVCAWGGKEKESLVTRGVWGHATPEIIEMYEPWNATARKQFRTGDDFSKVIIPLRT